MNKAQALFSFWSGFGIPAYEAGSVPDGATLPYITYETRTDNFGTPVAMTTSVWYRSSSWAEITEKETEIADFITRGGRMIAYDGGAMWITKASPWAQRLPEDADEMIRRIVLNVQIEFLD